MSDNTELLDNTFTSVATKLERFGISTTDIKPIDYGLQFHVSKAHSKSVLRIYANKKGQIKYDYSQIKDEIFKRDVISAIEGPLSDETVATPGVADPFPNPVGFIPLIGTDESGKGDYFGPLVAAGVYVDNSTRPLLERLGVRDSKKISDGTILNLAESIKRICAGRFAIIEISPETYNDLYDAFKKEKKNLNTLLAWGHAKAIEEILNRVDCDNALSDKFADEKFILGKLQEKGKRITLRQEHKAESNIAVAAASILARARFLEKMKALSREYQTELIKGASDGVIQQAKNLVAINGSGILRKIAKLHFKTTEAILGLTND